MSSLSQSRSEIKRLCSKEKFISYELSNEIMLLFVYSVHSWWGPDQGWQNLVPGPGSHQQDFHALTLRPLDCVAWINATNGELPSQAWVAWAPSDRFPSPTYVGRAEHNGGLFPATFIPHKGVVHVPWGGGNYEKDSYQVRLLVVNSNSSIQSVNVYKHLV